MEELRLLSRSHQKVMDKILFNSSFAYGDDSPLLAFIADDPAVLRKCAGSAIVDQWGAIDPIKGHTLIHLIALGAFEKTGANRNGDAFPWELCMTKHGTFITHGALYRNHKAEPSKKEGYVVKTAFNSDMGRIELLVAAQHDKCADWLGRIEKGIPSAFSMGFHCFHPDTLVRTIHGNIPISEIKEHDLVLTRSGSFSEVESVIKSPRADRAMVSLKMQTHGEPLRCTADHELLIVPRDQVRCPNRGRHSNFMDRIAPQWVKAESVKDGDYFVRPVLPITDEEPMDPDIAYLMGQYIGDGSLTSEAAESVQITTHSEDKYLINRMIQICLKNGWNFSIDSYKYDRKNYRKKQATSLRIRNPEFARMCEHFCGTCKDKYVRPGVWKWGEEAVKNFLGGYIDRKSTRLNSSH